MLKIKKNKEKIIPLENIDSKEINIGSNDRNRLEVSKVISLVVSTVENIKHLIPTSVPLKNVI